MGCKREPGPGTLFLRALFSVDVLLVTSIVAVLGAIAIPNYRAATRRPSSRPCQANQKTIAGALEMYCLDYNTSITSLDAAVLETLRDKGYLQSVPVDPGSGKAPGENYVLHRGEIACLQHGFVQRPEGRERAQAEKLLESLR